MLPECWAHSFNSRYLLQLFDKAISPAIRVNIHKLGFKKLTSPPPDRNGSRGSWTRTWKINCFTQYSSMQQSLRHREMEGYVHQIREEDFFSLLTRFRDRFSWKVLLRKDTLQKGCCSDLNLNILSDDLLDPIRDCQSGKTYGQTQLLVQVLPRNG